MARLVSLLLLGAVIVLLGLTFYHVLSPFLMPLFLAGVLAILCQPVQRRFLVWTKGRNGLSAGLTTFVALAMMLLLAFFTYLAARQLYDLAQTRFQGSDWNAMTRSVMGSRFVDGLIRRYEETTEETVDRDELRSEIQTRLRESSAALAARTLGSAGATLSFLGRAVSLVVSLLTFVIAVYYFVADGPKLIEGAQKLIPVHDDYKRQLLTRFDQAVRAVVSATFAAALGQGLATAVGMQIAGFRHFFIVAILATLTALVPLLGTWLVWAPYALWLGLHDERWGMAIFLVLYGTLFVGLLDNVIRTYVLHSNVKLHPLLAFVSVLGGIEVMGLWGIFIGPIVASCLHALIQIFNTELVAYSKEQREARATGEADLATLPLVVDELKPAPMAPSGATAPVSAQPAKKVPS
jgi:predicted PurR-regulated permease PerM